MWSYAKRSFLEWRHEKKVKRWNDERMDLVDRMKEARRVHGKVSHMQKRYQHLTMKIMQTGY
jgi:hypothetical protein